MSEPTTYTVKPIKTGQDYDEWYDSQEFGMDNFYKGREADQADRKLDFQERELKLKEDEAKHNEALAWGNFASGVVTGGLEITAQILGDMWKKDAAMRGWQARENISSMQENTKQLAIEAEKSVKLKQASTSRQVAIIQARVEELKAKASVRIEECRQEGETARVAFAESNKTQRHAQQVAELGWQRDSHFSPFAMG